MIFVVLAIGRTLLQLISTSIVSVDSSIRIMERALYAPALKGMPRDIAATDKKITVYLTQRINMYFITVNHLSIYCIGRWLKLFIIIYN